MSKFIAASGASINRDHQFRKEQLLRLLPGKKIEAHIHGVDKKIKARSIEVQDNMLVLMPAELCDEDLSEYDDRDMSTDEIVAAISNIETADNIIRILIPHREYLFEADDFVIGPDNTTIKFFAGPFDSADIWE